MVSPFRIDTGLHPPAPPPFASGWVQTLSEHSIYYEQVGNPRGIPVLVVHGGPGGEIRPHHKRLLDMDRCCGVFFDQRGCGQSTPFGRLEGNDTWALVSDIELIREHLEIDRWFVVAGSWGAALSLAYAQNHPRSVAGLVVSGVFLGRAEDIAWWWEGARTVFPEVFHARDGFLSSGERADARSSFHRRILAGDPETSRTASIMLSQIEGQMLDLWPSIPPDDPHLEHEKAIAYARILCWYDQNSFWLEEGQLLHNANKMTGIPGSIIAGRSDMCTPPKGAWDLSRAWPDARLNIVAAGGHRWSDELVGSAVAREITRIIDKVCG